MLILIVMSIVMLTDKSYKKYKKQYKEKIIGEFVKNYSENLKFCPDEGIPVRSYLNAEFERIGDLEGEDLIKGPITKDINIYMAEILAEKVSIDEYGKTTKFPVFHGIFVEADLSKRVRQTLKIRRNSVLKGTITGKKTKLNMDSLEFEKIFDVYTTNKIECMQILTSDVMQMLIDFKKKNKILPEITLKEKMLYIRFGTWNLFEPKFMKSALDFSSLKKYYDIITFTLELAEKFSKNILETEI